MSRNKPKVPKYPTQRARMLYSPTRRSALSRTKPLPKRKTDKSPIKRADQKATKAINKWLKNN